MNTFFGTKHALFQRACLMSLVAVGGCGPSTDLRTTAEPLDTVREDIINGDPSNNAVSSGIVMITSSHGTCSGTLLQNDVVLTARHCVTTDGTSNGTIDIAHIFTVHMGTQNQTVGEIFAPSMDVALLILPGFLLTGSGGTLPWGWHQSIYPGTDASLQGASVLCMGYGRNTFGGGTGALRSATLTVSQTTNTTLTFFPNPKGQIGWLGDSGSTCFDGGWITGVASVATYQGTTVQRNDYVGPEAYRGWALGRLSAFAGANIYQSTSQNIAGDFMVISDPNANGLQNAIVTVTHNTSPMGNYGEHSLHNLGVWYTGSNWAVFNQDVTAMQPNENFNVSVGGVSTVETATTANTNNSYVMTLNRSIYYDSQQILIVTPNWNPPGLPGVYNDHPFGVWFDGTEWTIYNEDFAPMPIGASFNVRIADPNDGAYVHFPNSSNTVNENTVLSQPNFNGRPGARLFVTHNFNPSATGGAYNPHPIGLHFSGSSWIITNEDGAAMPTNTGFNVMVRP